MDSCMHIVNAGHTLMHSMRTFLPIHLLCTISSARHVCIFDNSSLCQGSYLAIHLAFCICLSTYLLFMHLSSYKCIFNIRTIHTKQVYNKENLSGRFAERNSLNVCPDQSGASKRDEPANRSDAPTKTFSLSVPVILVSVVD